MIRILRVFSYIVLLGTFMVAVNSCDKEDDPNSNGFGTITGVVTDELGQPISDVKVTVSGVKEDAVSVTTGEGGKYTIENVSLKLHAVTFSKTDWLTISKSVTATDFDDEKVSTVNATLVSAVAKIVGVVTDARNNNAPLADVTVSVGVAGTAQSGSNGAYTIENLVADAYTVTFTKSNYVSVVKTVTRADFVSDVATLNVTMGGRELLRDLTAADLSSADKWHYNEYRGGRNGNEYPHWDWACDYMCTLDFRGAWQEQNEGTTLQIRNSGNDQNNPADPDVFDSFVFGSKLITEDNKIMSLRVRTHDATTQSPAHFGVQVIDLSAAEPAAVKIADKTYGSGDYTDFDFDLSSYVGKEVVIAIGTYRTTTGNYWKQLVLRAIRFANKKVENWDWLPGTEVIPGWKLSLETVRSTMPQTKKSFTGITLRQTPAPERDNNFESYREWRARDHVGATWSFVPLKKDPEVFPSEGYLIKTNGTPVVNTVVPEAYLYAKFSIAPGNNTLTFRTRNFSSTPTYFKLTAIEDNGTVTHVAPQTYPASASAAEDGCWKFSHQSGGRNNPQDYASFVYDLSPFNGKNVTLVIGVYNGIANSGENKLVFYSIDLN